MCCDTKSHNVDCTNHPSAVAIMSVSKKVIGYQVVKSLRSDVCAHIDVIAAVCVREGMRQLILSIVSSIDFAYY